MASGANSGCLVGRNSKARKSSACRRNRQAVEWMFNLGRVKPATDTESPFPQLVPTRKAVYFEAEKKKRYLSSLEPCGPISACLIISDLYVSHDFEESDRARSRFPGVQHPMRLSEWLR